MLQKTELSTQEIVALAADFLLKNGWLLTTAESCTGGLIAAACTDRPGASAWFDRGFVTYSNAAKTDMLGVPADLIAREGAVSAAVAAAMARGALNHSAAQVAVAVTGVAGPDGGTPAKPVGTVWLAWAWQPRRDAQMQSSTQWVRLAGDRAAIRAATVRQALARLPLLLG